MKILILNGSPHPEGPTSDMVSGFKEGAEAAGNEVTVLNVARMNIHGCLACEYCHESGNRACIQRDDMQAIYPEIKTAEMIVFASPIYYFTLSAQLHAVIQRTYCIGIPHHVKKTALILSSSSAGVYEPAISQYCHSIVDFWNVEHTGVFTAHGAENRSGKKRDELYRFGRALTK